MARGVQLLLPGLFDLPLHEVDAAVLRDGLPNLNRILGRASPRANRDYSLDSLLSRALDISLAEETDSLAMAQAFAAPGEGGERLMLIKGVHLRADVQDAMVIPIAENRENQRDTARIFDDLGQFFAQDCDLQAVTDDLFLLRLKNFAPPRHYPHPLSVLGRNVGYLIEQSRQVLPWYRLVNELQMYMHQHPVNIDRQRRGQLTINSLWAWGAGSLAVPGAKPVFYCDDELLRRFADSLGLAPRSMRDLGGEAGIDDALIVDLRLLQILKTATEANLEECLLAIEEEVLQPLLRAIDRRRCGLLLRAGYRFDFELGKFAALRFWRGPGNLADWQENA